MLDGVGEQVPIRLLTNYIKQFALAIAGGIFIRLLLLFVPTPGGGVYGKLNRKRVSVGRGRGRKDWKKEIEVRAGRKGGREEGGKGGREEGREGGVEGGREGGGGREGRGWAGEREGERGRERERGREM